MWISLAFLAVVVIAVVAFRLGHTAGRRSVTTSTGPRGELVRVVYDGREYANPDEMPSDERAVYERTIDTVVDRNRDGRIDVLEPLSLPPVPLKRDSTDGNIPSEAEFDRREQARRTFQQLKQLETLRNDGMITSDEYSSKRRELLKDA